MSVDVPGQVRLGGCCAVKCDSVVDVVLISNTTDEWNVLAVDLCQVCRQSPSFGKQNCDRQISAIHTDR